MQANLSNLQNFYQHVTCNQRGKKTLNHHYSTHRDAYKALPRPPFAKSEHNSILLIPAYKQKLKQEVPVTLSIRPSDKERDTNQGAYKKSRYALRQTIKQANHQYIESYYTGSDARRMWQGLKTITDYDGKPRHELPSDRSLPDELNCLFSSLWGTQHWTIHESTSRSGQLCDHALDSRWEQDV
jgi:hypothetical protein